MAIVLRQFDIRSTNPSAICVILGSRATGKTTLIPMTIPQSLCANIDYIFLFRDGCCQKGVYERHAHMFPSQQVFDNTMNECTSDHGCLVISNSTHGNRLEDNVFWYKAPFANENDIKSTCKRVRAGLVTRHKVLENELKAALASPPEAGGMINVTHLFYDCVGPFARPADGFSMDKTKVVAERFDELMREGVIRTREF
jgi:hypothetical protein